MRQSVSGQTDVTSVKGKSMHAYRSHTCNDLKAADVGNQVRLSGWVHRVRDHGGVLFIDLRDHYGITQVIADSDSPAFADINKVRAEWVVQIDGRVKGRDAALVNPKLPTVKSRSMPSPSPCWALPKNCRCRCSARSNTPRKPA